MNILRKAADPAAFLLFSSRSIRLTFATAMRRTSFLYHFTLLIALLLLSSSDIAARMYQYSLSWTRPNEHYYYVTMVTQPAADGYTLFRMPAWRPGRYIMQNFAAAVSMFSASDSIGLPLVWQKTDKDTWKVKNPASGGRIFVRYRVYSNNQDAGSAYLDDKVAYFNSHCLFMYVAGDYSSPVRLEVASMPKEYTAATALKKTASPNVFLADSYHQLLDSPTILSASLHQFSCKVGKATIWFHFQGKYKGSKELDQYLIEKVSRLIEVQTAVWGELPLTEYHLIYYLLPFNIRHAVEHEYSSMYALPESVTESKDAARGGILGITSHELFHLWNVKRLRPAALWPYQYEKEACTGLHWWTEGVTDYYADVALVRAGIVTHQEFLNDVATNFMSCDNVYATRNQSTYMSSWESWLAPSAYMDPHNNISYYTLGYRVGALMDVRIRAITDGKKSLDDICQNLYQQYYKTGVGMPEEAIQMSVEKVTGQSWQEFFTNYVNGCIMPEYSVFLNPMGIEVQVRKDSLPSIRRIGIELADKVSLGVYVRSVMPGSDAALGGLADKDLIMEVNGGSVTPESLKNLVSGMKPNDSLKLKVLRDGTDREFSIIFTGNDIPYQISLTANPDNAQKKLLYGWIGKPLP